MNGQSGPLGDVLKQLDDAMLPPTTGDALIDVVQEIRETLVKCSSSMKKQLVQFHSSFDKIESRLFCNALLHPSMMRNVHSLKPSELPSNEPLSFVGDAYFSLYVARYCFETGVAANQFHIVRQILCCNAHLSRVFDKFFGTVVDSCFKHNAGSLKKHKAQILEALIGLLVQRGYYGLADVICKEAIDT